ncbi:hypothetical protein PEP31012_03172 [Pandoraea eparura]|jgi:hypothetical protein|uniref:Uncharacterized protein n=1 Tax=Pandoraea eparura TaxID=2508291 RepID=A0A5E4WDM4_9BURK|nr:hypothetical protein PEP31012_03172 [Pandoraea eparura]
MQIYCALPGFSCGLPASKRLMHKHFALDTRIPPEKPEPATIPAVKASVNALVHEFAP